MAAPVWTDLDLNALRSFVVVAERLNFAAAARELGISPPALTRRIQKLERVVGAALLDRGTRHVALTQAGLSFLPAARGFTADLAEAVAALRRSTRVRAGQLVLACLPTMAHQLLPRIIRDFRTHWPEIHLRVIECGAASVVRAVRAGDAEFGFTFRAGPDSDLAFEPILRDPYCLAIPAGHPLAAKANVKWTELKAHRLITAGSQSGNMRLLEPALRGVDWRPETAYEIDHLTTSLGMVEAGLGIAVLPRSALPSDASVVAARPLVEPRVERVLGIYRRRGNPLPSHGQRFLTTVRRVALEVRAKSDMPSASLNADVTSSTQ